MPSAILPAMLTRPLMRISADPMLTPSGTSPGPDSSVDMSAKV